MHERSTIHGKHQTPTCFGTGIPSSGSFIEQTDTGLGIASLSVDQQQLFTVHSAMVYVIQVCRQLASLLESFLQTCMTYKYEYTIAECTVNNS
jgi:hypothetical protein